MEDNEIVSLFLSRNEKAVEETQLKYGRYCFCIANNILASREDSEECVNEALCAAWQSIPPHNPGSLKTYIGKITRENAISRWRKGHASKRIPSEYSVAIDEIEEIFSDDSFERDNDGKELSKAISDYLRGINETDRKIFIRRYWYCDSIKDICVRFNVGESRVKSSLKRTRDKLADYLKKEGYII